MVQFNKAARGVEIKVVYYGPALSGKTTNLQKLHEMLKADLRGELLTLNTKEDRTLFFDLLPVQIKTRSGYLLKLKVFTVPGQVLHDSTRRVVLQGADGVVFVADSQKSQARGNAESFRNLYDNLTKNGIPTDGFPVVMQYNKRDLPSIKSEEEVRRSWGDFGIPVYLATAIDGEGVVETFVRLVEITTRSLSKKHRLEEALGFDVRDFITAILAGFGRKGSKVPPGVVE